VEYDGRYYFLRPDGTLDLIDEDLQIPDISYNAFTIDLLITWHFAPGSQMTIAWKNVIDHRQPLMHDGYVENFRDMLGHPQINSFSVRFLYYIDFQMVERLNQRLFSG